MYIPNHINLMTLVDNPDAIQWERHSQLGRVGVSIHRLFQDTQSGQHVSLIRCEPGAFAEPHHHGGHETFFILDGSVEDEFGTYGKGGLVVYQPGSTHRWRSPNGALICLICGGPVNAA